MPAHVLHVLTDDERRGAQSFGLELHQVLVGRGWSSEIVCLAASPAAQRLPVPALGAGRHSPVGLLRLRRRARQCDVVVAHGSSTLLGGVTALFGTGVPLVYVSIGDPRFWWRGASRRARVRLLLRRAAAVVAISEAAREAVIEHAGLAPGRVRVIPNGRSGEAFVPPDPAERRRLRAGLGLDPCAPVVAWVGALSHEKRPDLAVRVASLLPDVHLLMAGDGDARPDVAAAVEGTPGRVHLLGRTERVRDVLAAADVLLLTSDSEGVPGVLIEAGLVGVPAVTTDVGFVRDVVADDRTGRVVAAGDAEQLAAAVRDVLGRAPALGAAARARCLDRFELGRVADRWQELLEAVRRRSG